VSEVVLSPPYDRLVSVSALISSDRALHAGIDQLIGILDEKIEGQERIRDAATSQIASFRRQRAVLQSLRVGEGLHLLGERPTKPSAVVSLLKQYPNRSFRLIDIRRELIRQGAMDCNAREIHALEVAVRALDQRGVIERIRRGTYRLAKLGLTAETREETGAERKTRGVQVDGARSP
jgi:hypothetical protein